MITEHELGTYCVFFLVLHTQKKLVACVNYGIRNDVHDFQDKHVEKTKLNYVIIVIFFWFLVWTRLMFAFNSMQNTKLS
jgi:hypothetical protein